MRIVNVTTDDFTAEALAIDEMPWQHVMLTAVADPYRKRLNLLGLFKNALCDTTKREEFDRLSYRQAMNVLDAYVTAKGTDQDIWEHYE